MLAENHFIDFIILLILIIKFKMFNFLYIINEYSRMYILYREYYCMLWTR